MPKTKFRSRKVKTNPTSVESEVFPGRPPTSRNEELIEKVRRIVMEDCRATTQGIGHDVEIGTGSVHSILMKYFCMRRISAKLDCSFRLHNPRFLGHEQHTTCSKSTLLYWDRVTSGSCPIWKPC